MVEIKPMQLRTDLIFGPKPSPLLKIIVLSLCHVMFQVTFIYFSRVLFCDTSGVIQGGSHYNLASDFLTGVFLSPIIETFLIYIIFSLIYRVLGIWITSASIGSIAALLHFPQDAIAFIGIFIGFFCMSLQLHEWKRARGIKIALLGVCMTHLLYNFILISIRIILMELAQGGQTIN